MYNNAPTGPSTNLSTLFAADACEYVAVGVARYVGQVLGLNADIDGLVPMHHVPLVEQHVHTTCLALVVWSGECGAWEGGGGKGGERWEGRGEEGRERREGKGGKGREGGEGKGGRGKEGREGGEGGEEGREGKGGEGRGGKDGRGGEVGREEGRGQRDRGNFR